MINVRDWIPLDIAEPDITYNPMNDPMLMECRKIVRGLHADYRRIKKIVHNRDMKTVTYTIGTPGTIATYSVTLPDRPPYPVLNIGDDIAELWQTRRIVQGRMPE